MAAWRTLLLGLALTGSACGPGGTPATRGSESPRPDIIFLTVDTLRRDHLETYGYDRETMPAVARLAKSGVVFENAITPRGATRPSYASLLTGLYPHRHGVRYNHTRLHPDNETLPEILSAAGYETAAVVSNFVLTAQLSGLDQGFEHYDDFMQDRLSEDQNYERTAIPTYAAVRQWLEAPRDRPFFLLVNLIDPHGPYTPPEYLDDLFQSDTSTPIAPDKVPDYQKLDGVSTFEAYRDRYDREIRHTDEALGLMIEEFRRSGVWEDALVIFAADHGESMGEHGVFFDHHWHVWQETTGVPLIVRLPAADRARQRVSRVETVAALLDLAPTVLDYLGLREAASGMDGMSLLDVVQGGEDPERVLLLEYPNVTTPWMEHPDWYAARGSSHALVRALEAGTSEVLTEAVFDVENDPLQLEPLRPEPGADRTHARLSSWLDRMIVEVNGTVLGFDPVTYQLPSDEREAFVERQSKERGKRPTLTESEIEKLRSLGYIR